MLLGLRFKLYWPNLVLGNGKARQLQHWRSCRWEVLWLATRMFIQWNYLLLTSTRTPPLPVTRCTGSFMRCRHGPGRTSADIPCTIFWGDDNGLFRRRLHWLFFRRIWRVIWFFLGDVGCWCYFLLASCFIPGGWSCALHCRGLSIVPVRVGTVCMQRLSSPFSTSENTEGPLRHQKFRCKQKSLLKFLAWDWIKDFPLTDSISNRLNYSITTLYLMNSMVDTTLMVVIYSPLLAARQRKFNAATCEHLPSRIYRTLTNICAIHFIRTRSTVRAGW